MMLILKRYLFALAFPGIGMWILAFASLCLGSTYAQETAESTPKTAIQFEITVLPCAKRHVDVLAYPPYLAVALMNNGINPGNWGNVTILDRNTLQLQFMNAVVRFVERKGSLFIYKSSLEWNIGPVRKSFKLLSEVDIAAVEKGKVVIRVFPPLATIFPDVLTKRIRGKIQSLANEGTQKVMLNYFDDLEKKRSEGSGDAGTIELILRQAYNLHKWTKREPGDAEPLSDQVLLLATLTIWFIIVPVSLLVIYIWRRHKRRVG